MRIRIEGEKVGELGLEVLGFESPQLVDDGRDVAGTIEVEAMAPEGAAQGDQFVGGPPCGGSREIGLLPEP